MYLLDTHALLWMLEDDKRYSGTARNIIANPANICFVSAVTGYEINLKVTLGKLDPPFPSISQFIEHLDKLKFSTLPIHFTHMLAAGALPMHHRDPFDRMLIAQAQLERLTIITNDPAFAAYDVETVW